MGPIHGKCLCAGAPVILLVKRIQTKYYEFPKKLKKIPDVANGVSHKLETYSLQIICILSYTKMTEFINLKI